MEQTERGIGLYVNLDKTEFMHFNEDYTTSLSNNKLLKLVD